MAHVVLNAYGEVVFWFCRGQVVINGFDHRGREFFGGETVASAYGFRRDLQRSIAELDSFLNTVDDV